MDCFEKKLSLQFLQTHGLHLKSLLILMVVIVIVLSCAFLVLLVIKSRDSKPALIIDNEWLIDTSAILHLSQLAELH